MARWSSLYRYGAKGRGMQAVARKANATIPMPSRIEQALRAVPSVSQAQNNWPAPPPLSAVLQDLSPELGYAERDRVLKKISLAAQLHQADHATVSYLGHFSQTLTESLGEAAKPVLPIFQELLAAKELRSRYLERRRSLLEQKQAAESSTLHLKVAIAALEDSPAPLKEQSQEQPTGKTPERLWRSLGLADSAPPSVPPSYGGPTVVGGLPGMQQRMKMRYESQVPSARRRHPARPRHRAAFTTHTLHPPTHHTTHTPCPHPHPPSSQVYALQEEAFRAHALLREIDGDGPSRAVEAVVAAKEAVLLKELAAVVDKCERASLQLMYDQRAEAENLEALA